MDMLIMHEYFHEPDATVYVQIFAIFAIDLRTVKCSMCDN